MRFLSLSFSVTLHPDSFPHVHSLFIELLEQNEVSKIEDFHVGDIHSHFSQYGPVLAVNVHVDRKGAFIIFELEDSLSAAVSRCRSAECKLQLGGVSFPFRAMKMGW